MSAIYDQEFQPVTVDAGDLSEVCQAANAWASVLRTRAEQAQAQGEDPKRHIAAADRIDKAAHDLRQQAYGQ
jgi:hypothetical protein